MNQDELRPNNPSKPCATFGTASSRSRTGATVLIVYWTRFYTRYTGMAEAQLILDTPGDPASDERPRRLRCRAPPLIDRRDLTLRRLYRRSFRRQSVSGHSDILRAGDAVEG